MFMMPKIANESVESKSDHLSLSTEKQKLRQELQELIDAIDNIIAENSSGNSKEFGWLICDQLSKSCYANTELLKALKSISMEMKGIAPKDQVEGMLAAQMIATHHAAMNCFRIAAKPQTIDMMNLVFNSANKLIRSYTTQIEALNRYRGKGQQKMTVEHVHINSGGQAIIGNVTKNDTMPEGVKQGVTLENE
jgi:hypothetical protein